MPKVASRNIDRYKIDGGQLNEYEVAQNRGALTDHLQNNDGAGQRGKSELPPDMAKAEHTKELLAAHSISASPADKSAEVGDGAQRTTAQQRPNNQQTVTPQGAEADNTKGIRVRGKDAKQGAGKAAPQATSKSKSKVTDGPGPATTARPESRSTAGTSSGARNATARSDRKAGVPSRASFAARSGKGTTTHAEEKRTAPAAAARGAGRTTAQARADRPSGTTTKRTSDEAPTRNNPKPVVGAGTKGAAAATGKPAAAATTATSKRAVGATTTSARDRKAATTEATAGRGARARKTAGSASGQDKTAAARSSRSKPSKR